MVYHRKSFLSKMDEIVKFAQDNNCTVKWYGAGDDAVDTDTLSSVLQDNPVRVI